MKKKVQFTTVALEDNEYLIPVFHSSIVETYCKGFVQSVTGGRDMRKKDLDGHYFTKELKIKTTLNNFNNNDYNKHIDATIKPL